MIDGTPSPQRERCAWCGDDPLYVAYHDEEWGVPLHDDRRLFELLILEGAQAGLAWITILRKREGYRRAFEGFDPQVVARYEDARLDELMGDPCIVRNRLKIKAARTNARAFLNLQEEHGSFDRFLWSYVGGEPLRNRPSSGGEIPAETPLSQQISRDLRRAGMTFVGPTIVYAYLQSAGLVNDHVTSCFRGQ